MTPRIGSLCSGYGGLELGLMAAVGGSVAWHVEYDKHPSAVLEARFPDVPNYGDVTTTDWTQVEPVDWLTAGYPCQPFSHAGKRKGSADERHLWPAVADAIGVLRPRRVLLENVAGHVSLGLDAVLADLAALGYDSHWGVVRAADAGAPHNRARIFIVATDADDGGSRLRCAGSDGRCEPVDSVGTGQPAADADSGRLEVGPELDGDPTQDPADRHPRRRHPHGRSVAAPDAPGDGWNEGRAEPAGLLRRPDAAVSCPGVHHCKAAMAGGGVCDTWCPLADPQGQRWPGVAQGNDATPLVSAGLGAGPRTGAGRTPTGAGELVGSAGVEWGAYESAIRRWEHVTGRTTPRPTEPGRSGERLSPRFVEWLMGLPAGWVTDVGIPRNAQLKALGNGVVPQQAALAVRTLLGIEAVAA